jgi:hypothetical protein
MSISPHYAKEREGTLTGEKHIVIGLSNPLQCPFTSPLWGRKKVLWANVKMSQEMTLLLHLQINTHLKKHIILINATLLKYHDNNKAMPQTSFILHRDIVHDGNIHGLLLKKMLVLIAFIVKSNRTLSNSEMIWKFVKKPENTYLRSIRKYSLPSHNRYLPIARIARRQALASPVTNSAVGTPPSAIIGCKSNLIGPTNLCTYSLGTIC